jgi:hypothetical protein
MGVSAMLDRKFGLPLAFLLAMSLAPADAKQLSSADLKDLLQRGSLKELLSSGQDGQADNPRSAEEQNSVSVTRMAQWFNWMNCFNGFWRRC